MNIGVLGGTFDPVHIGHLLLAERAREQFDLARVLWVPAGDPWRKEGREVSEARHRVEMVRRAIEGNAAFEVCMVEVDRGGPSYTVDTIVELGRTYGGAEFFFLLGQDALVDVANWHEPKRLVELVMLTVAPRDDARPAGKELDGVLPGLATRVVWVEMPRIDVSGTELRRRAAEGKSLRYAVSDAVEAYIREEGLYVQAM